MKALKERLFAMFIVLVLGLALVFGLIFILKSGMHIYIKIGILIAISLGLDFLCNMD
ncbi:MAG: hypothetical protein IKI57_06240 [Clostridia bacterium]|nr:hypothetical protein [Clostridia bacterium]